MLDAKKIYSRKLKYILCTKFSNIKLCFFFFIFSQYISGTGKMNFFALHFTLYTAKKLYFFCTWKNEFFLIHSLN